jgi:hypothetical protein
MQALIQDIVSKLKVDNTQATAGAAILFKAARDKMGAEEFNKLLGNVAGIDALISQAPAVGGVGKLFGGFASALGGNAALITTIVTGFGKLGLTADHANKFVPVILDHLRGQVGKPAVDKLEQTLRA